MNNFFINYKHNKKFKFWCDFIFIFLLPQIALGILFTHFSIDFRTKYTFKLYLFFQSLFCISIYISGIVILLNDSKNLGNFFRRFNTIALYLYIIISLFIMNFYNGAPYTLISYSIGHFMNMIENPFNELNCDSLCGAFKFLITGNYFDD